MMESNIAPPVCFTCFFCHLAEQEIFSKQDTFIIVRSLSGESRGSIPVGEILAIYRQKQACIIGVPSNASTNLMENASGSESIPCL